MAIVETEGLDSLTMPKLAEAADVAVGGLYRYFASKDAMMTDLQVLAARRFADLTLRRLESDDGAQDGPLGRVLCIVESWPLFAFVHRASFQLLDASLSNLDVMLSDEEALRVEEALEPVFLECARALDSASTSGELSKGDPRLRTYALWAVVHGVGHFQKRDRIQPETLQSTRIRKELIGTLLIGWGASKEAVEAAWERCAGAA